MKKNRKTWANHILSFLSVILGVYLAFYLNERAALKREAKERQILMNSLILDLSEDIETYEGYLVPVNSQLLQNIDTLLGVLLDDPVTGIGEQLGLVFQVENGGPTTSTYNSMKFSSNLNLMDDLMLQKELTNFYEGLVEESILKGELQAEYFTDELLTWVTDNVDLKEMKLLKEDNLISLRNKLIVYQSLVEQKVDNYTLLVKNSKKLKLSIESKLK